MGRTYPPLKHYGARSKKERYWNHKEGHRCWKRWECSGRLQYSHSHRPSWHPAVAAGDRRQRLVEGSMRRGLGVGSHLVVDSHSLDAFARLEARQVVPGTLEDNWHQVV